MIVKLYLLFLKLGAVSFGGGYALMALIYEEGSKMVGLTAMEFADLAALELLASGPIAINAATYVGYIKGGILGAIVSTVAICTPCILFCTLVLYFLSKYKDSKYLNAFMNTIKMATGGLMLNTSLILAKGVFILEGGIENIATNPLATINVASIGIFIISFLGLTKFKLNPIKVILIAAVLGMIFLR